MSETYREHPEPSIRASAAGSSPAIPTAASRGAATRRSANRLFDLTPSFVVGVYAITSICGMLDAASFLGLGHVFVEIMTGNLVYLAFSLGSVGNHHSATVFAASTVETYVVSIGTFCAGAVAGGRFVRHGEKGRRAGFVLEWVLVAGAVVAVALLHPGPSGYSRFWVIGMLSFAMGVQNALLRRWGVKDLATNVMTLTLTAWLAESALGGGRGENSARRGSSIVIFVASAMVGAFLVRYGVIWPVLTAFLIFTLAMAPLLRPADEAGAKRASPGLRRAT